MGAESSFAFSSELESSLHQRTLVVNLNCLRRPVLLDDRSRLLVDSDRDVGHVKPAKGRRNSGQIRVVGQDGKERLRSHSNHSPKSGDASQRHAPSGGRPLGSSGDRNDQDVKAVFVLLCVWGERDDRVSIVTRKCRF